jgi:penicillin-binding protein 1A
MLVNKTKEALLANRLEEVYSKEEILALYFNTIPFGENVYGIESASRLFFNKSVEDLEIQESAVLIGMLKANTYYNPRLYPDHAELRRNVVFNQMYKYEYINEGQLDSLKHLPLKLDYDNLESSGPANYFLVHVKKELTQILKTENAKGGKQWDYKVDGLKVVTTLNLEMQNAALKAFESHLVRMQKLLRKQYANGVSKSELDQKVQSILERKKLNKSKVVYQDVFEWKDSYSDSMTVADSIALSLTTLQAGFLAVHPKSGDIVSYVGGIDYRSQPYDQIISKRQLASTFKPILYASALEKGMSPCDYLSNTAKVFTDHNNWKVSNYDHSEGGDYSLTGALIKSKNIPSVDLLFKVGFDEVDYLWRKLGFTASLQHVPPMALGVADASLKELAIAYSAFANGGQKIDLHTIQKITTSDGTVIYEYLPSHNQRIMEDRTATLMNVMLQKAVERGTGTAIRNTYNVNIPLAGKTGTSQNFGDAWFASYNSNLVMVTRVGASYSSIHFNSGANGSGGRLALPISARVWSDIENSTNLSNRFSSPFPEVTENYQNELNCPDFEEDNAIESIMGIFSKKSTTMEESEKRGKPKKSSDKKKRKKRKGLFKKKQK